MKKNIIQYIIVFLALIAFFFSFSVISSIWPDQKIKRNISKAALEFNEAGLYPNAMINVTPCRMDNFTETIVLNQIFCIDRSKPLRSAMGVYRGYKDPWYDTPGALLSVTRYETGIIPLAYPRYWHGNTFLFRILFSIMDYHHIQWMMFAITTLLIVIFICAYYPLAGIWKTLAFILSWTLVYGFIMPFSIQFFPSIAMALIASILIVQHEGTPAYISLLFFITACCTNYFDLFTIPLLTFGLPLIAWLSIQDNQSIQLKATTGQITQWGILWVIGYGLTFLSKWVLASLVLKENILKDGFGQSFYRMNADGLSRWDAVGKNLDMLPWIWVCAALILFLIVSVLHFQRKGGLKALYFLLIASLPYLWYLVVSNHSELHFWFTYRLQFITLSSLFMALLSFSSEKGSSKLDYRKRG